MRARQIAAARGAAPATHGDRCRQAPAAPSAAAMRRSSGEQSPPFDRLLPRRRSRAGSPGNRRRFISRRAATIARRSESTAFRRPEPRSRRCTHARNPRSLLAAVLLAGCTRDAPARRSNTRPRRPNRRRDDPRQRMVRRALRGAARLLAADETQLGRKDDYDRSTISPRAARTRSSSGCAARFAISQRDFDRNVLTPEGADVVRPVALRPRARGGGAAVSPARLRVPSDGRAAHGLAAGADQFPSRRRRGRHGRVRRAHRRARPRASAKRSSARSSRRAKACTRRASPTTP